jgi:hypothetical protein
MLAMQQIFTRGFGVGFIEQKYFTQRRKEKSRRTQRSSALLLRAFGPSLAPLREKR